MTMDLSLRISDSGWRREVKAPARLCRRAVRAALDEVEGSGNGAIALLLTNDEEIAQLNEVWRGKAGPTNVLSFPDGEAHGGGDIVVALGTVLREANACGRSAGHHLSHLVVHGVLHLLGYRHDSDSEAAQMERQEAAALARIGVPDPYGRRP